MKDTAKKSVFIGQGAGEIQGQGRLLPYREMPARLLTEVTWHKGRLGALGRRQAPPWDLPEGHGDARRHDGELAVLWAVEGQGTGVPQPLSPPARRG